MKKLILILTLATSFVCAGYDENRKVMKMLIEQAEKEYPNDYSMQFWKIEKEFKAYEELSKLKENLKKVMGEK